MDTPRSREISGFIDELNELRRRAGSPSLGELVKLSDRKLTKSTLSEHLTGRRTNLPTWRMVFAYVTACHSTAHSTGLDSGRLGTIEQWRTRWDAAAKGDYEVSSPFAESPNSGPTEPFDSLNENEVAGQVRGQPGDYSGASVRPVFQRFQEDLRSLQQSLSIYDGLLVVTNGPKFGAFYKINHNITTIGRDPECDIWLNEPTVSRRHAEISCHGDQFAIHDLKSKNGTFCRGKSIADSILTTNDELRIGRFRLLFAQGGSTAAKVQPQSYGYVRSGLMRDSIEDTTDFGP